MATGTPEQHNDRLIALARSLASQPVPAVSARRRRGTLWQIAGLVTLALLTVVFAFAAAMRSRADVSGTLIDRHSNASSRTTAPTGAAAAPTTDSAGTAPPSTTAVVLALGPAPAAAPTTTAPPPPPTGPIKPFRFVIDGNGRGRMSGALPSEDVAQMLLAAGGNLLGADRIDANYVIDPRAVLGDEELSEAVLTKELRFREGAAGLTSRQTALLADVVAILTAHPEARIRVEGHTDDRGDDAANVSLSQSRAQQVVDFLFSNGVSPAQIVEVVGLGEVAPRSDNSTEEGRADNRRVDIHFVAA